MFKKLILFCTFLVTLSSCGLEKYPSGHLPTQARLSAIQIGDSKEKVIRLLGTPASESPASSTSLQFLIYSKNLKESQAFFDPKEVERDVYVYYFNSNHTLIKQEHLTLQDHKNIPYNKMVTQTSGRHLSVAEQIVNNFGRYNSGRQDSSIRQ